MVYIPGFNVNTIHIWNINRGCGLWLDGLSKIWFIIIPAFHVKYTY